MNKLIEEVILKETNKNLQNENESKLSLGEFYRRLGIMMFMATVVGSFPRKYFWIKSTIDPFKGAPYRCSEWMSYGRYEAIRQNLSYTNKTRPLFKDTFWEVWQMIEL